MSYPSSVVTTCLGAAAQRDPAAGQVPPSSGWRAIVADSRSGTLLRLDPESAKPIPLGTATSFVELRDPSRLLTFGSDGTTATLFLESPPRTVGPVSLGDDCRAALVRRRFQLWDTRSFSNPFVESGDGRRLMLRCATMLINMDLQSGEMVNLQLAQGATHHLLSDQRLLTVSHSQDRSSTEGVVYDANTLAVVAHIHANTHLSQPALVSGGREILLVENGQVPGRSVGPMSLRYFAAASGAPTRTTSLKAPFGATRVSADGRYVFASNMNRYQDKPTPRELRLLAAETGELLESVELLEHSSWFLGESVVPAIENRRYRAPTLSVPEPLLRHQTERSEGWCRKRGSNPHSPCGEPDFESGASASSAIPAREARPCCSRPRQGFDQYTRPASRRSRQTRARGHNAIDSGISRRTPGSVEPSAAGRDRRRRSTRSHTRHEGRQGAGRRSSRGASGEAATARGVPRGHTISCARARASVVTAREPLAAISARYRLN